MPPPVTNVPKNEVGEVVQQFINAGSTNIVVTKEGNGTYKVVAQ